MKRIFCPVFLMPLMALLFVSCNSPVDSIDTYIGSYVIEKSDPVEFSREHGIELYYLRERDTMQIMRYRSSKDTVVIRFQHHYYLSGIDIVGNVGFNMGVVTSEGLLLDSTCYEHGEGMYNGKDCNIMTSYTFSPAKFYKKKLIIPYSAMRKVRFHSYDATIVTETYEGKEIVAIKQ